MGRFDAARQRQYGCPDTGPAALSDRTKTKSSPAGELFCLHFARIALRPFPAEPEHRGLTTQIARESMGPASRGLTKRRGNDIITLYIV